MTTSLLGRIVLAGSLVACMTGPRSVHHAQAKEPPGVKDSEVSAANKRGDIAYLDKVCSGELPVRKGQDFVRKNACTWATAHKDIAAALGADCSTLLERWKATTPAGEKYVTEMAHKFAKCNRYTDVFEQVAPWGSSGQGGAILRKLAADGTPLEARFLEYARRSAGEAFLRLDAWQRTLGTTRSRTAMENIGAWLIGAGAKQHCKAIVGAVTGAQIEVRLGAFNYFKAARCAEAIPLGTALLASTVPDTRIAACSLLGTIGDASVLPKLKLLADGDGHNTIRTQDGVGVKVWPVRDACSDAATRLGLR